MAQKKSGLNTGEMVAIGAGVAALGAAAYLMFGPEGKKNRKNFKGWMVKMKGEIMEKIEDVQELTAPMYESIVNEVSEKYRQMKNVDPVELAAQVASLRKGWKKMMKDMGPKKKAKAAVKKAASKAKPAAKKAVKKARA